MRPARQPDDLPPRRSSAPCERDERTLDRAALLGSLTGFARKPRARSPASRSAGCCASARSASRSTRPPPARSPPASPPLAPPPFARPARHRPARLHGRRQREAHDQADRPGQETPPEGAPREGHPQGQLHAGWRKGDLDNTPGPAQAMRRPNESPTLTFRHASARRPGRRSSMKPRCEQRASSVRRIAGKHCELC